MTDSAPAFQFSKFNFTPASNLFRLRMHQSVLGFRPVVPEYDLAPGGPEFLRFSLCQRVHRAFRVKWD